MALAAIATPATGTETLHIYTGPLRSSQHVDFGPRLAESLEEDGYNVSLRLSDGAAETLRAVLENPSDAGFAQRDLFDRFLSEVPAAEDKLELYGEIPFCVLAIVRTDGPWSLPLREVPPGLGPEAVDAGPKDSDTQRSLAAIVDTAPRLEGSRIENRGGSRALARLRSGEIDVALFLEFPSLRTPIVRQVQEDDRLAFIDNIASLFLGANTTRQKGFVLSEITIPSSGIFDEDQPVRTICTAVGVVVNAEADRDKLEAIVHPVTKGVLTEHVYLSLESVESTSTWILNELRAFYAEVAEWF